MLTDPEVIFTLAALGSSAYLLYRGRRYKKHLPPSPAGAYPLIGHALIHPTEDEHLTYAKWCKELNSDIVSVTVLGQTIVILDSVHAATDLLDHRSTIYSDRPYLRVICDSRLFDWGRNIAILSYGPRWRKQRRIMHEALKSSVNNIHNFALFEKEAYALLKRLATSSEYFEREFRRTVAAEILSSVYGYTVKNTDDPLVRDNATLVENFTVAAVPGNFLVNFIPWLKYVPQWFPGAKWKRTIVEWRRLKERVMNEPYEQAKAQIASGFAPPSIVQTYLASIEGGSNIDLDEEEENLRLVSASLFGAAADTTHASLMSFMLAMVRHPEVQARAQEEIDRVTSSERLPKLSDRESMPYVQCIIQEVLRWQPPLPLGVPHATVKDDEYRGYFIPKGSIVMANAWAMGRNESVYKSPETFRPERFLDANTPSTSAFGFGRRSCPGSHYAEASLFVLFASVLAVFDIKPKVNPVTGQEEIPEAKVALHALVSRILPFECTIEPRSDAHKELIESA